ncbi:MAG: hypothetical protein H6754_01355 [Candidatus Omnitrophica bacterium]|nr:hypothetical protein [Candidatus Omnitrophota bacterium]
MNKSILLPAIVGIAVLACIIAVSTNLSALKKSIGLERYNRIEAERKLDAAVKNSILLDQQLVEARRKLDGIQNILSEGQNVTSQLKSTVEATSKENENLKATIKKLQDELIASQKAAQTAAQEVTDVVAQSQVPAVVN